MDVQVGAPVRRSYLTPFQAALSLVLSPNNLLTLCRLKAPQQHALLIFTPRREELLGGTEDGGEASVF